LGDVTKTVYDNLFAGVGIERLADGGLQRTDRAERTGLNEKLGDLLSFFRNRSGTRKKIKQMLRQSVEFDERDFQVIARDFDVTPESAAQLLGLLKSCFSKDGRFLRAAFERNIPAFAQYERKVFQFLWQYLKDITFREDRVAFLNALQLLISRLKQPNLALHVLLDDLVQRPDQVAYSDRNALILSNILVRRYNKELTNDVEVTPEEVLLVRDGLDKEIVKDVSARLDREQEGFFIKVRALHRAFKESLDPPESGSVMPIRYLATLEREAYIFLSLVGGNTAHTVVRSAVKEYGNPDAEIYHLKKSPMSLKVNLQLLQVTMRGVIRFGDPDDLGLLKHVRGRLNAFLALKKATDYHEMVRRVMRWAGTD
jgi:hypothetical protein